MRSPDTQRRKRDGAASPLPPGFVREVVSANPAMRDALSALERLAASDITVTITGETGSGKDVLARRLHATGQRAAGPFVVFDCAAVAPTLIESELFGHERGAFTGAHAEHLGAFERADGGTLFLDELGELPLDLQARLLRALEDRTIRRVGGKSYRRVDVRVVAATNRQLELEVAGGRFRSDLFYRLAAAMVHVPPLRDRMEDLPGLVARLLDDLGRPDVRVSPPALELLASHRWPGNVRELKNTLARALAFIDGDELRPEHVALDAAADRATTTLERLPLRGHTLESVERAVIKQALDASAGDQEKASRSLGITVAALREKMRRYGLSTG